MASAVLDCHAVHGVCQPVDGCRHELSQPQASSRFISAPSLYDDVYDDFDVDSAYGSDGDNRCG